MFDAFSNANPFSSISREESEPTHIADPLADLLLSVAAIIVLAVIAILPTIPGHSTLRDDQSRSIGTVPDKAGFRLQGVAVDPFVAIGQGLVVGPDSSRVIPVDRIFFDEGLVATLQRMRDAGESVVLLVDRNGFETAFQFEVMVNRHGPKVMHQVRLEAECSVEQSCRDLLHRPADQRR
jgi:hypothetical protein